MSVGSPLTWPERAWLLALVVAQLAMVVLLPAFNGPDERGHFVHMWALVDGHLNCKTVPQAVRDVDRMRFPRSEGPFEYLARGRQSSAAPQLVDGWDYMCTTFAGAYVPPALVARLVGEDWHGHPRPGSVFVALYAARITNLLLVDAALLLLLWLAPRARTYALTFFCIPMMLQQAVVVGHDAQVFAVTALMAALALQRPSWRAVACLAALGTWLTLLKPVYAFIDLLALPMIVRLWPPRGRGQWAAIVALAAPLPTFALWGALFGPGRPGWHPSFCRPGAQLVFVLTHPWHFIAVMFGYLHYFIDDHVLVDFAPRLINGKWTTIFAVFGNSEFEMGMIGYPMIIAALALALFVDARRAGAAPPELPPARSARALRWARVAALSGVLVQIPATILAMYLFFSHPFGLPVYGVQGRYQLPWMLLLGVLGIEAYRRRRRAQPLGALPAGLLLGAAAALALGSDVVALTSVHAHYWR